MRGMPEGEAIVAYNFGLLRKALMLLEECSRCEEHCHKLASTERVRPRAFAVLLIRATVKDDSCRSAHVFKAFCGVCNEDMLKQEMLSASRICMQNFLGDLRYDSRRFGGKRMPSVPER
eukprot:796631-Pelagomonas_calceolata.AAC.1